MNSVIKIILFIIFSFVAAVAVDITLVLQFSLVTYSVTLIVYFLCSLVINQKYFKNYIYFFLSPLLALNIFSLIVNPLTFPIFSPITFIFATLAFFLGQISKSKINKRPFLFYLVLLLTLFSFAFVAFYYTPRFLFNRNRETFATSLPIYDKLKFSNLDGTSFEIDRLKNKVIFIDNWFLSCYQCNLKLPSLQSLFEKAALDSTVMIISLINGKIDSLSAVAAFVNKHKELKFQILYDKENSLGKLLKIDGYPIEIIVDKSGYIKEKHDGFNKDERLIYVSETYKKINSYK